jgi:hypothetical protein
VSDVPEPSGDPAPVPETKDASASSGSRAKIAQTLSVATRALVARTSRLFGELKQQGGHAVREFQSRPEHARWRAYALGSYGLIVVATLVFQFYDPNPLGADARVQRVEIPRSTYLFVRNGSRKPWKSVKLTLNGVYGYSQELLPSGGNLMVQVDQFNVVDAAGVPSYAPPALEVRSLHVDCDRGSFDKEFKP